MRAKSHSRSIRSLPSSVTATALRVLFSVAALGAFALYSNRAFALPSDFIGRYEILDRRQLALSGGAIYVIQDGQLIVEMQRKRDRPYCRALQTTFDEAGGNVDVRFELLADGTELAKLATIPVVPGARSTKLECFSETGFFGTLDLSIALGQIFRLSP